MAADASTGVASTAASTGGSAALSSALERYEPVIGIEIHCQLKTASKMFCSCSTAYEGAAPNTHCCPTCLGLPGTLPVINRQAVEYVLACGIAIDGESPTWTRWDRKNYFYPDLPKGYQISQYDLPLAANGKITFDTSEGEVTIRIRRAHLEEDTAKLIHAADETGRRISLVDFNRSGCPLMEIVTEPDVRSGEQARRYAEELRLLFRSIGISEAEMENGQMRVEANVSLRPRGTEPFGIRTEVKNMNSLRSVERAIAFEIERQAAALDAGETLKQQTRGWDDAKGVTYLMRMKEDSMDYRYFPEPDLPPLHVDAAWLDALRSTMPELPAQRRVRYQEALGLSAYDANVIVADGRLSTAFEALRAADPNLPAKEVANWVTGEYARLAKDASTATGADGAGEQGLGWNEAGLLGRASAAELAAAIRLVVDGAISRNNGKQVFGAVIATGASAAAVVAERGLGQISDSSALEKVVDEVLAANPAAVEDFRAGKEQAVGFLVGQIMRATRGQANAGVVQPVLRSRLEALRDSQG